MQRMKLNSSSVTLRSLDKSLNDASSCRWPLRHLPNLITLLRLISVPAIYILISLDFYIGAFCVFAFAGISDWADGYLARKWHVESAFGRIFDPIADKALMIICFLTLGVRDHLPLWLVILTVARDLAIILAGLYAFWQRLKIKFQPIMVSKLNTFLQILLVGVTLLFHSHYTSSVLQSHYFDLYQGLKFLLFALIAGCAITTLWSWYRYGVYFIQELKIQKKDGKNS